jgi:hypothetical protein
MTEIRRPQRQLELPVLSEVNGKLSCLPKSTSLDRNVSLWVGGTRPLAASQQDLSVYDQISQNYFRSLKKA